MEEKRDNKWQWTKNEWKRFMCLVNDEIGASIGTRGVEWSFRKSSVVVLAVSYVVLYEAV